MIIHCSSLIFVFLFCLSVQCPVSNVELWHIVNCELWTAIPILLSALRVHIPKLKFVRGFSCLCVHHIVVTQLIDFEQRNGRKERKRKEFTNKEIHNKSFETDEKEGNRSPINNNNRNHNYLLLFCECEFECERLNSSSCSFQFRWFFFCCFDMQIEIGVGSIPLNLVILHVLIVSPRKRSVVVFLGGFFFVKPNPHFSSLNVCLCFVLFMQNVICDVCRLTKIDMQPLIIWMMMISIFPKRMFFS